MKLIFSRICHILAVIMAFGMTCRSPCGAQGVPDNVHRVSATQLSRLLERAADEQFLVTALKAYVSGNRIVFTAQFSENEDNREWLSRLNLPSAEMDAFAAECEAKGLEQTVSTRVRIRGRYYHSGIWVRTTVTTTPLVLPIDPLPESGVTDDGLADLDQFMRTFMKQHNVAGATLAVMLDRRLVYARGFGYADAARRRPMHPDSEMRVASISKTLTAGAALMLAQQGAFNLEDAVLPILREGGFPALSRKADTRWRDVTIRHLLQHSGGWDRTLSDDPMFETVRIADREKLRRLPTVKDIIRYQLKQPLDFAPGKRHAYSNFGYALLGKIVEIKSRKPYAQCISDMILTRSGMRRTRPGRTRREERGDHEVTYHMQNMQSHQSYWRKAEARPGRQYEIPDRLPEPDGRWDLSVMLANAGWVSTAPDLMRFIRALDDPDRPLLNHAGLNHMVGRPDLNSPPGRGYWYGCGWNVSGPVNAEAPLKRCMIWHYGNLAGTSALLLRRDDGFAWAVLFNCDKSRSGEKLNSLIDRDLHDAIDSVASWPTHDLFEEL